MHVPVYLVCAALVVVVRTEETTNYFGRKLEPVDVAADQETISYLLPRLTSKYRPNSQWSGVNDPRFYVLTEMESNNADSQGIADKLQERQKREHRPSLSITNSMDVLRNRLMYELNRKKIQDQIKANREFLDSLGNDV